jgi:WS/DGAT/MGAT family acyltransferase
VLPTETVPSLTAAARIARAAEYRLNGLGEAARAVAGELAAAARHPIASIAGLAARVGGLGRELAVAPARSPLDRQPSLSRRLATFELALADIDAVRRRVHATNNDVLLTVVSGALHRWHTSRGADVKTLRALVPVNVRQPTDDVGGNRIALLAIALPVGEPSPRERLRLVQQRMGRVKSDHRAALYPVIAEIVRALPPPIAARIVRQQMHHANVVCTNVPGPSHTCWFAGQAIDAIYAFAPMIGDHPFSIAAYRYRDVVHVGLDVDPVAMPDFPHLKDAFAEAWVEVRALDAPDEGVTGATHGAATA